MANNSTRTSGEAVLQKRTDGGAGTQRGESERIWIQSTAIYYHPVLHCHPKVLSTRLQTVINAALKNTVHFYRTEISPPVKAPVAKVPHRRDTE